MELSATLHAMSQSIHIRAAVLEDYEPVSRVFEDENRYHAQLVSDRIVETRPLLDQDWYQKVLDSPTAHLAVACEKGHILGLGFFLIKESEKEAFFVPRRYLYVQDLAVVKAARRKGLGKKLMDYARNFAKQNGLKEIELHVWEANKLGIAFYEKDGFRSKRRLMTQRLMH